MTDRKSLSLRPQTEAYDVGYKKPPMETRFKKGVSGNAKGRPKGALNRNIGYKNLERLKDIILEEAYREVTVHDGSQNVSISVTQAIIRSIAVNAAKGNQRAQKLFSELVWTTERENRKTQDEWVSTAINYKVEWDRELERRERLGITAPAPIPHPDHIQIDLVSGGVKIKGPMTKEEKKLYDLCLESKPGIVEELRELEQLLIDEPDHEEREEIIKEIKQSKKALSIIRQLVPD